MVIIPPFQGGELGSIPSVRIARLAERFKATVLSTVI